MITIDDLKFMLSVASASTLIHEGSNFYLIENLKVSNGRLGEIEHTIKLYAVPSKSVFNPVDVDPIRIIKTTRTYTDLDWMNASSTSKVSEVVDINVKSAIRDIVNGYFIKLGVKESNT